MNVIVGWIVGNTQSGPHSFRKKKPLGWQYSDGLVTQSYHEAEVARLRAEDSYQKMLLEQAKGTILNLRVEADALRVDAMRYRFIRDADRCDEHIRYEELLMYAEENLDEAIDAAMGASA